MGSFSPNTHGNNIRVYIIVRYLNWNIEIPRIFFIGNPFFNSASVLAVGNPEYRASMTQVSRKMLAGHPYQSSHLSVHHLLRRYKKILAKVFQ